MCIMCNPADITLKVMQQLHVIMFAQASHQHDKITWHIPIVYTSNTPISPVKMCPLTLKAISEFIDD